MMLRGCGHIKDVDLLHAWVPGLDHLAREHAMIATAVEPESADLSKYVDHVRDQLGTSSCVAQSLTNAVHIRAGAMGLSIAHPSALALYASARVIEEGRALTDDGLMPRDAAVAAKVNGLVAEADWPFSETAVNTVPPWDIWQKAIDARLDGVYRITGYGEDRLAQIRRALAAGCPVIWATQVDGPWDDAGEDPIGDYSGPSRGGHMTCLVGYGPGYFLDLNSWGTAWAREGFALISPARIANKLSTDFMAVSVAPKELQ